MFHRSGVAVLEAICPPAGAVSFLGVWKLGDRASRPRAPCLLGAVPLCAAGSVRGSGEPRDAVFINWLGPFQRHCPPGPGAPPPRVAAAGLWLLLSLDTCSAACGSFSLHLAVPLPGDVFPGGLVSLT